MSVPCRASVRGHKSAKAQAKCPACSPNPLPSYQRYGRALRGVENKTSEVKFLDDWSDADKRVKMSFDTSADPEILRDMALDADSRVRFGVAENTSTPPDVLDSMARADYVGTAWYVSANVGASPDTLRYIVEHGIEIGVSAKIVERVAKNPNAPEDLLLFLAQHKNSAWEVHQNPNASAAVLALLSENVDPDVRRAVTLHDNCPPALMNALRSDPIESVAKTARLRCAARLGERFDIDERNTAAIDMLIDEEWWNLEKDDPQVDLVKTLIPDPSVVRDGSLGGRGL